MTLQKNQANIEDIKSSDIAILRELSAQISEIAGLPVHARTISEWKRTNDLKQGRPMVWINEEPWHEIEQSRGIYFCCENSFARNVEVNLRRILYRWDNIRTDMVVEPVYRVPIDVYDTGFGVSVEAELVSTQSAGIVSRHFIPQIKDEKDISKIRFPEITVDRDLTKKKGEFFRRFSGKT